MKEVCSCGASFKYERPQAANWDTSTAERLLKEWRTSHRHEMPEPEPTDPLIHESNSSHERFVDEFPIEDRALVGFQRNEVR